MMKKLWNSLQEISKVLLLLLLLAGTFSYAMFQGGFVSWFLFYSFLPFSLYSILIMLYPLSDFNVTRSIQSEELKAGSRVTVTIQLNRKFPIPLFYLVVEDQVSTSFFSTAEISQVKKLIYPGFKQSIKLQYEFENLPRGEHHFTSTDLKTGDFLGIFQKSKKIEAADTILVYPSYVPMTYQPIQVQYDQGVASTDVKIQRDTTMATGLREYQPGDRVSWIHWKSFARTNDLMTKEFEERKSHDVCLILDRTPSPLFEDLVSFIASLSRAVLKKGAQAGYISSGNTVQRVPVKNGDHHQRQIDYQLAKVQADSEAPFNDAIKKEISRMSQSVVLLVVTSSLTRELVQQLHDYSRNNSAVAVFLVKNAKNNTKNSDEQQIKALASSKGIMVRDCFAGHFSNVFAEVKQA
ncbi:DUF58 domain-containing protein [Jeotgalibacillus sp. ET6]|uniref:DUF58 domain-containing protein n=1 Tax=Jeotgalibacillus sp. ET6 TaxID=3037260 RepID=UPI002418B2D7|nr:DUF58 domain-containing protein [Jeotgalibacillus sp. ET6]MDG5473902.1 DUF58 domain-containing protein [Jeotgalibacillus sp. ET6]